MIYISICIEINMMPEGIIKITHQLLIQIITHTLLVIEKSISNEHHNNTCDCSFFDKGSVVILLGF